MLMHRMSPVGRLKRLLYQVRGVLGDLPDAALREYDYLTGRRRSAILALTWRCTGHCLGCTAWRRDPRPLGELSGEQWLTIAARLVGQGVCSVELFGGDVLLRKDALFPLCLYLHDQGVRVHIATNGSLLDERAAEVFAESVWALYLSTDGLGQTHDAIRGAPGTFDRLAEARRRLLTARGTGATPKLVCNTTVCRDNVAQLADLARFALVAGYDEIDFEYLGQFESRHAAQSCVDGVVPSPIFMCHGESRLLRPGQVPVLRRQLERARALAGRPTVSGAPFRVVTLNIDVLSDRHLVAGTVPGRRCFVERAMAIVNPFGQIVPCLFFDNYPVGQALEDQPARMWNSPARRAFRARRDRGELALCRHCIMSVVRSRMAPDIIRRAVISAGQRAA